MLIRVLMKVPCCLVSYIAIVQALVCNIVDYGAINDGITINTQAISKAIKACENTIPDVQNTLFIPSGGIFLTGSIQLTSGINLYVDEDAILLGSELEADYPVIGNILF